MNKTVAIIGGGESGVGAALLAKQKGLNAFVSDAGKMKEEYKRELIDNNIPFEEKGHSFEKLENADVLVKSPGVPDHLEFLKKLKEQGSEIISEIEFGFHFCDGKIVGITGSNGKTTTTGLLFHILKRGGLDAALGGNIGDSFCRILTEEPKDIYVLELSSFQLDGIKSFKADVGILLNITADHLDRYQYDLSAYANSKFRICENQGNEDWIIYNQNDPIVKKLFAEHKVPSKQVAIGDLRIDGKELSLNSKTIFDLSKCSLKGKHNLINITSAAHAARILGLSRDDIQKGLDSFKNAPHRLETIAVIDGIEYINDSKATNVDAVWYALDAMEKPIIWIAGGTDKGNNYDSLQDLVGEKVKALICLGLDTAKISDAFKNKVDNIVDTNSMSNAMSEARKLAGKGDVVLLSPACASFDLFNNYIHRGEEFRREVWKKLK